MSRFTHPLLVVAGPVLFTLSWLVLGLVSPGYTLFGHTFAGYSPISQPISGLGLGVTGPFMNTAFVVTGLMLMAGMAGVHRAAGGPGARAWAVLLGLSGAGQALCGLFTLERMMPHTLGYVLAIGAPVIGFPLAARYFRRLPQWRRFGTWLLAAGPLTLLLMVAFLIAFQPTADGAEHDVAGLVQRLGVLEVQAWFAAMGWLAFSRPPSPPSVSPSVSSSVSPSGRRPGARASRGTPS